MLLGIAGKANVGKSTFLSACSTTQAEIASYPFTTINPNLGVTFVSVKCPHVELGVKCSPRNSRCEDGVRKVPVNIVDIAGLVPGAHEGRGLGNQFLTDIATADGLICVVDASGSTDDEGRLVAEGTHDPCRDVEVLETEMDYWLAGVIERNLAKAKGKGFQELAQLLSGVRVNEEALKEAMTKLSMGEDFSKWKKDEILGLATQLRKKTKPMVIAANKVDSKHAEQNVAKLREAFPNYAVIPAAADAELALKRAQDKGIIKYDGKKIEVLKSDLPPKLLEAIRKIEKEIIAKWGSTGVFEAVNKLVFDVLAMIVVFPVEDEKHYGDHFGNVLPDAILLEKGSTAVDLASKIHTDLAKGFLYAVDARTNMRLGKEHELKTGDVIRIVSAR